MITVAYLHHPTHEHTHTHKHTHTHTHLCHHHRHRCHHNGPTGVVAEDTLYPRLCHNCAGVVYFHHEHCEHTCHNFTIIPYIYLHIPFFHWARRCMQLHARTLHEHTLSLAYSHILTTTLLEYYSVRTRRGGNYGRSDRYTMCCLSNSSQPLFLSLSLSLVPLSHSAIFLHLLTDSLFLSLSLSLFSFTH